MPEIVVNQKIAAGINTSKPQDILSNRAPASEPERAPADSTEDAIKELGFAEDFEKASGRKLEPDPAFQKVQQAELQKQGRSSEEDSDTDANISALGFSKDYEEGVKQGGEFAVGDFAKETAKGVNRVIVGGAMDSVEGVLNLTHDIAAGAAKYMKENNLTETQLINDREAGPSWSDKAFGVPMSKSESIAKSIMSYVIPYMGAAKIIKGASAAASAKRVASGIAISTAITDPDQERLSNTVKDWDVPVIPAIAEYLAYEKDDSRVVSRFKTAMEAALIDIPLEAAGIFIKAIKAGKEADNIGKATAKEEAKEAAQEAVKKEASTAKSTKAPGASDAGPTIDSPMPDEVVGELRKTKKGRPILKIVRDDVEGDKLLKDIEKTFGPDIDKGEAAQVIKEEGNVAGVAQSTKLKAQVDDIIDRRKRGIITDEQALAEAGKIVGSPEKLDAVIKKLVEPGAVLNTEEMLTAKIVLHSESNALEAIQKGIKDVKKANPAELAAFSDQLRRTLTVFGNIKGAGGELGRSFRSLQTIISKSPENIKLSTLDNLITLEGGLDQMRNNLAAYKTVASINERIGISETVGLVAKARQMGMKLSDSWNAVAIENLLSDFGTSVANFSSGVFVNLLEMPVVALSRGVSKTKAVVKQKSLFAHVGPSGVQEGETYAVVASTYEGLMDGFSNVKTWFTKGKVEGLIPMERPKTAGQAVGDLFGIKKDSGIGFMLKWLGEIHASGSTATQAADVINTGWAARRRLRQLAHRNAMVVAEAGGDYQTAYKQIMKEDGLAVHKELVDNAKNTSFTRELDEDLVFGTLGKKIDETLSTSMLLRPATFFVRFGFNAADYGIRNSPIFFASPVVRKALAAGGEAQDEMLSRIIIGNTLLGGGAYLASTGRLSGSGSTNYDVKKMQEQLGLPTDSIMIGGKWHKYSRTFPAGFFLGVAADISEILSHYDEGDNPNKWQDLAAGGAVFVSNHLLARNILDITDAMGDVNRMLNGEFREGGAASLARMGIMYTPFSGLGKVSSKIMQDPETSTQKDMRPDDPNMSALNKAWDRYKKEWLVRNPIAGFGDNDLPPIRNRITGEPMMIPTGLGPKSISPIVSHEDKSKDVVYNELLALQMAGPFFDLSLPAGDEYLKIQQLPRSLSVKGIPIRLTPEQYDRFGQLAAGQGLKKENLRNFLPEDAGINGQFLENGLYDTIRFQIESDWPLIKVLTGADKNTDTARVFIVKMLISKFQSAAQQQLLLEYPELTMGVAAGVADRMEALGFPEAVIQKVEGEGEKAVDQLKGIRGEFDEGFE